MAARRLLLGWVLFALVCAQSLGLMHRVVHGVAGNPPAAEAHAPAAAIGGWTEALFAHDKAGLGCKLFDGLGQCGAAPQATQLMQPLPAAAVALVAVAAAVPHARPSSFEARAPPVSR